MLDQYLNNLSSHLGYGWVPLAVAIATYTTTLWAIGHCAPPPLVPVLRSIACGIYCSFMCGVVSAAFLFGRHQPDTYVAVTIAAFVAVAFLYSALVDIRVLRQLMKEMRLAERAAPRATKYRVLARDLSFTRANRKR